MANKHEHIDDFLNQKFEGFESLPDDAAWNAIANDIEHLSHPIDHSLNQHLSELSAVPPNNVKPGILGFAAIGTHPIDIALHERLSVFESIPDKYVYNDAIQSVQNQKQKKRRFVLWFTLAMVLGVAGLGTALLNQSSNTQNTGQAKSLTGLDGQTSKEPITNDAVSKESTATDDNLADHLTQQDPGQAEKASPSSKGNHQFGTMDYKTPGKSNLLSNDFKTNHTETIQAIEEDESSNIARGSSPDFSGSMKIILFKPFKYQYEEYIYENIRDKKSYPGLPKKRLSPFSINVQFGYANESATRSKIKTDNAHKDALTNYRKANGNSKNGDIISVNFGYRLNGNFIFKTGFQYSSTIENSSIDYTYTELPIYHQGVLKGYFTRPASQSPHIDEKVKNKTTSYSVPVQLYARIFEFKKLSVWTGIGSELILKRTSSGRLFSFEDEEMKDFKSTTKNTFSPNISFLFQYNLRPGIAITGNLQTSYLGSKMNFDNTEFVKREILPSLRLGILYTPIIPAK